MILLRAAIGFACFIFIPVLTLSYLGFRGHIIYQTDLIPNQTTMYLVGALLGMLGALLMDSEDWKASIPAGWITGVFMVGFALFYLCFRQAFYLQEFVILFFVGITPGFFIYRWLLDSTAIPDNTVSVIHYDEYEEVE